MQKIIRNVIAVLIITGGVVLFNYPTIATFVNNAFASREVSEYTKIVENMDEDALQKEIDMALAYNQSLPLSFPADPFSTQNIRDFTGTEFENFDLIQPGAMIGYIEVPQIDVYQPVYYGTSDEVLDKGLGLVENTSLPVGGPGTHAVISGHTGMATRKLFTDLVDLVEGDLFFVHVLNQHFAYKVDQIRVVWPEETEELAIRQGQDYVTLVTCTPFGINDHRLLVRGSRVDYDFTKEDVSPNIFRRHPAYVKWVLILSAGLLLIILFILKVRHDHKKDQRKAARQRAGLDTGKGSSARREDARRGRRKRGRRGKQKDLVAAVAKDRAAAAKAGRSSGKVGAAGKAGEVGATVAKAGKAGEAGAIATKAGKTGKAGMAGTSGETAQKAGESPNRGRTDRAKYYEAVKSEKMKSGDAGRLPEHLEDAGDAKVAEAVTDGTPSAGAGHTEDGANLRELPDQQAAAEDLKKGSVDPGADSQQND